MFDPLNKASLKPARHKAGLTQEDLAAEAEVTQKCISDIEIGARDPKLSTWIRIANVIRAKLEAKNG